MDSDGDQVDLDDNDQVESDGDDDNVESDNGSPSLHWSD
jgi:hypothetical protein